MASHPLRILDEALFDEVRVLRLKHGVRCYGTLLVRIWPVDQHSILELHLRTIRASDRGMIKHFLHLAKSVRITAAGEH